MSPPLSVAPTVAPVHTRSCVMRCARCVNESPHVEHVNGFSPVWVLTCCAHTSRLLNAEGQWPHWKGRGFRCRRCSRVSSSERRRPERHLLTWRRWLFPSALAWPQCGHTKGFSPVWILSWPTQLTCRSKPFPQWRHE